MKIPVAEDDDLLRDVIYNILVLEGYEVFSTVNGRQALDFFVSVKPDLIVSDIMMPEMDGFELLEEVRSLPHGVTMPFLFLTARTERTDIKKARTLGVDDYLFKPFRRLGADRGDAHVPQPPQGRRAFRHARRSPPDRGDAGERDRGARPAHGRSR